MPNAVLRAVPAVSSRTSGRGRRVRENDGDGSSGALGDHAEYHWKYSLRVFDVAY